MSQAYFTKAAGRNPRPGEWILVRRLLDGALSARVSCPVCGASGALFDAYEIDAAGFVTPEVLCLAPGCGYSERARLEEWDPTGKAILESSPAELAQ